MKVKMNLLNLRHDKFVSACAEGKLGNLIVFHGMGLFLSVDTKFSDDYDNFVLLIASSNGHLRVVKYLIYIGRANVHNRDFFGNTALYVACQQGHLHIVRFLVERAGADVNVNSSSRCTPFHAACNIGNLEMLRYLISKGAQVNDVDNMRCSPLVKAASRGFFDSVRYLIEEAGADVMIRTIDRYNVLHAACDSGNAQLVSYLLTHFGSSLNQPMKNGQTPLKRAILHEHLDVVRLLLEFAGVDAADVNALDQKSLDVEALTKLTEKLDFYREKIVAPNVKQEKVSSTMPLPLLAVDSPIPDSVQQNVVLNSSLCNSYQYEPFDKSDKENKEK